MQALGLYDSFKVFQSYHDMLNFFQSILFGDLRANNVYLDGWLIWVEMCEMMRKD